MEAKFPNFKWEKEALNKLLMDDEFKELDEAKTDADKIMIAISMMAEGDTEVNPELKRRMDAIDE